MLRTAIVGLLMPLAGAVALAGGGDKPKPTVTFARTWDSAVAEAQLLNVPIVVHSHGFY